MSLKELTFEGFVESNRISNRRLKFAVLVAKHKDKLVLVKNKKRTSWELPGGKREYKEHINDTATRELQEETGAKDFKIYPVSVYGIKGKDDVYYGKLFYADIYEFGELPDTEIDKIELFKHSPDELTYPLIHPHLISKVEEFLNNPELKLNNDLK